MNSCIAFQNYMIIHKDIQWHSVLVISETHSFNKVLEMWSLPGTNSPNIPHDLREGERAGVGVCSAGPLKEAHTWGGRDTAPAHNPVPSLSPSRCWAQSWHSKIDLQNKRTYVTMPWLTLRGSDEKNTTSFTDLTQILTLNTEKLSLSFLFSKIQTIAQLLRVVLGLKIICGKYVGENLAHSSYPINSSYYNYACFLDGCTIGCLIDMDKKCGNIFKWIAFQI